jgi:hypothetical protein
MDRNRLLPMAEHEMILDAAELDRLVLECGHCGGRAVIPLTALGDVGTGRLDSGIDGSNLQAGRLANVVCTACGQALWGADRISRAYFAFCVGALEMAKAKDGTKVRFLLRVPSPAA